MPIEFPRDYDGSFPEPDLWDQFKGLVKQELRRRRMWKQPPRYLGNPDYRSWSERGALDELAVDAFVFAVVVRLPALLRRIEKGDKVEGLVRRNIRNFLTERQKRCDPCGFAAYKNVEAVIRSLVDNRCLSASIPLPEMGKTISPAVVLRSPGTSTDAAAATAEELWRALTSCERWRSILPNLIRGSVVGQRELAACLTQLGEHSAFSFLFGDLVELIKSEARAYRDRLEREAGTESGDPPLDGGLLFEELVVGIRAGIARISNDKQRDLVQSIFDELARCWEEEPDAPLPQQSELGRILGEDRRRISEAFAQLRRIVEECGACESQPDRATAPAGKLKPAASDRLQNSGRSDPECGQGPGRGVSGR